MLPRVNSALMKFLSPVAGTLQNSTTGLREHDSKNQNPLALGSHPQSDSNNLKSQENPENSDGNHPEGEPQTGPQNESQSPPKNDTVSADSDTPHEQTHPQPQLTLVVDNEKNRRPALAQESPASTNPFVQLLSALRIYQGPAHQEGAISSYKKTLLLHKSVGKTRKGAILDDQSE